MTCECEVLLHDTPMITNSVYDSSDPIVLSHSALHQLH
jgi:hypothetical protein